MNKEKVLLGLGALITADLLYHGVKYCYNLLYNGTTYMEPRLSRYIKDRSSKYNELFDYYDNKSNTYDICKKLNIPCPKNYFILDKADDLKSVDLPDNCVIKYNNLASSKSVIIKQNGKFTKYKNLDDVINYLNNNKEQNQKNFQFQESKYKQQIIVEELLIDDSNCPDIRDIKLYVFNGECKYILITEHFDTNGFNRHYDKNFIPVILKNYDYEKKTHVKPKYWDDIIKYGEKMAKEFFPETFLRLDFYSTTKGALFGEFTFNPGNGGGFTNHADLILAKLL